MLCDSLFHITLPALLTNVVFVAGRRHHQMVSLIQIYLCPSLRPPGMRNQWHPFLCRQESCTIRRIFLILFCFAYVGLLYFMTNKSTLFGVSRYSGPSMEERSIAMSVSVSVCEHISEVRTTRPNYTKFSVHLPTAVVVVCCLVRLLC